MRLQMRLKKTLFAAVASMAVASMVVPSAFADINLGPRRQQLNRSQTYRNKVQELIAQHGDGPIDPALSKQRPQKQIPNRGLSKSMTTKDMFQQGLIEPIVLNRSTMTLPGSSTFKAADPTVMDHIAKMGSQPLTLTEEQLAQRQIRPAGSPTETAEEREARFRAFYAERQAQATKGGNAETVLPSAAIPEDAAFSAAALVSFSTQTHPSNATTHLVADLDGNLKLDRDFDNLLPGLPQPRTGIDREGLTQQVPLLAGEVYTDVAISGHTEATGFAENVYYTGSNAGFVNVELDSGCDSDVFADSFYGSIALSSVGFSARASVVGLAVEQDAEYDGDPASDEILWISVFDPEFGSPSSATSALLLMIDINGDDIPDPIGGTFVFSTGFGLIAGAGVAVDSYGSVHWHVTDNVFGLDLVAWDIDEDRIPDVGFTFFNFGTGATINFTNMANAVEMAIDRNDRVFYQIAAGTPSQNGAPQPTGLPSHIAMYTDVCGDFDPLTGLIPRPDHIGDTDFQVFASQAPITAGQGGGTGAAPLVLPDLVNDFSGYAGLATDYDDNIYVAVGAEPVGLSNQSRFIGAVLRIPDWNCDGVGDVVDWDGDRNFGVSNFFGLFTGQNALAGRSDYLYIASPNNPATRTPEGIDGIDMGPLTSLNRLGLILGDDDGLGFRFDDLDGDTNAVAGGVADLLVVTECENVGSNLSGVPVGFEWLFLNIAWTGFRLSSNGQVIFRNDPTLAADEDPAVLDFTPTVPEFLTGPPRVAPAWHDFTPNGGGQFSVNRLGFAAVDSFIIQWINYPTFGRGGVGVGLDAFGFPTRGETNSFDVTFYDDQDTWDDVDAEIIGDTTNLDDTINNDDDGLAFPAAVGLGTNLLDDPVTRIFDRNGDGDVTDESLVEAAQEGVGRTLPEQGPFQFRYHQMELNGTAGQPAIVGFSVGAFDGFNTGTVPPGLCETNLSQAINDADAAFDPGEIDQNCTEPALYEFFNEGSFQSTNPNGTINPAVIDFDLRDSDPSCIARPTLFLDTTFEDCLIFCGSNMPVGLFCQSIDLAANSPNDDPFVGPTTFTISGFKFPEPETGENAICPQFCGQTAPLCRPGKTVTYTALVSLDEDCDGDTDSVFTFGAPDVTVTDENTIKLTIDFSDNLDICGGCATITVIAEIGFGDNNIYFETRNCDADAALEVCPIQLVCSDATDLIGFRAPIVTSIAPDQEDCTNPSSPGDTEDVQITGFCFFGDITSAFLATNPDGTGTRFDLSNITHVVANEITATVPVRQLAQNVPYYVFVVRGDGVRSTNYPNPLGYNVTFTCRQTQPEIVPSITSCRLVRVAGGKFVLQVNGQNIDTRNGGAVLKLNGTACPKQKFPAKFIGSNGMTTRINCSGGVKKLLPATLTITNPDGATSVGFPCNF